MCFMDLPPKRKNCSKTTPKVSPDKAHILLGIEGARFSFSGTSKLPSNLFVRQDFYGTDKTQASILNGTTLTRVYDPSPYTLLPTVQAHYGPATAPPATPTPPPATATTSTSKPTSSDLVMAVSEAQRLACNLKDACFSQSSCSSRSRSSHSRDRDRDRDILLLSIERKNVEEIAALRLERDIERKIKDVVRDRDVQALVTAAGGGGGLGYGGGRGDNGGCNGGGDGRWGNGASEWAWSSGSHAQLGMEREDRALRERERERERERDRNGERRMIGAGGAGGDAQMHFNLFQDLSSGGGRSRGGGFADGNWDGWERRRSSVASTLNRGARRLAETMARVEAEVDFMRGRDRDRRRGLS